MGGGPKGPGRPRRQGRWGRVRDLKAEMGLSQTQRTPGQEQGQPVGGDELFWNQVGSQGQARGRPQIGVGGERRNNWRRRKLCHHHGRRWESVPQRLLRVRGVLVALEARAGDKGGWRRGSEGDAHGFSSK